jgi:hypothetical protein
VTLFKTEIWVASVEDLILYKLVAHRYKDLGDTDSVLVRMKGRLLFHVAAAAGEPRMDLFPGRLHDRGTAQRKSSALMTPHGTIEASVTTIIPFLPL